MSIFARLRDQAEGSALLEFAIVLPLLVVFVVGIYDFSGAFNQRQKVDHAARAGAVIAGAQPMDDMESTNPNPASLQPVVDVILQSMVADNLLPAGCPFLTTATPNGGLKWTYTITGCTPDPITIVIDRGVSVPLAGDPTRSVLSTSVVVTFTYHWQFNSAIQLLFPGASYAATTPLTETAIVHNQT